MLSKSMKWPLSAREMNRLIELQDQLMEEKILKKSRFVVKEAFDLGLKRHYSKVAWAVESSLKTRGYQVKENAELLRDKRMVSDTKKEMVRIRLHSNLGKTPNISPRHPSIQTSQPHSPRRLTSYQRRLKKALKKKPMQPKSIDNYFIYDELKSTRLTSARPQCKVTSSLS